MKGRHTGQLGSTDLKHSFQAWDFMVYVIEQQFDRKLNQLVW